SVGPSAAAGGGDSGAHGKVQHPPRAPVPGEAAAGDSGPRACRAPPRSRTRPRVRRSIRHLREVPMAHNLFQTLQEFRAASGKTGKLYSLPALEKAGVGKISRLPVSIRIVLESVLRNCDGKKVTEQHVRELANWSPNASRTEEIPFVVARVVLQD